MLHSLWIAPVLFYPCPENEPDVRPLQAELKFNLRAVSCIRPVQNSHEPKAPPSAQSTVLAYGRSLDHLWLA